MCEINVREAVYVVSFSWSCIRRTLKCICLAASMLRPENRHFRVDTNVNAVSGYRSYYRLDDVRLHPFFVHIGHTIVFLWFLLKARGFKAMIWVGNWTLKI